MKTLNILFLSLLLRNRRVFRAIIADFFTFSNCIC